MSNNPRRWPAPLESAKSAGLVYVDPDTPGITRLRCGRGFRYVGPGGRNLTSKTDLDRIRRLAIPPAWTDVWICPAAEGHLQATGRDARGRKQYRYHSAWRTVRDDAKYEQMLAFATALPRLRRRIARDLAQPGLSKRTVIAAVIRLLERTLIRVGNDEYSRDNHSYGLTTLRNGHARASRSAIRFRFRGKGGKAHDVTLEDARLARIVRRCQELPGHELFGYVDDEGQVHDVGSGDVNEYLREETGQNFTAKNFRTWSGTLLAACALQQMAACHSKAQAKRNLGKAIEAVSGMLRNTPAICRKSYIHPAVIDAYMERTDAFAAPSRAGGASGASATNLRRAEKTVLTLLRRLQSRRRNGHMPTRRAA